MSMDMSRVKKEMKRNKSTAKIEFELHEEMMKQSNASILQSMEQELSHSKQLNVNKDQQHQEMMNALKKELRILKIEKERWIDEYDKEMVKVHVETKARRKQLDDKIKELFALDEHRAELKEHRLAY